MVNTYIFSCTPIECIIFTSLKWYPALITLIKIIDFLKKDYFVVAGHQCNEGNQEVYEFQPKRVTTVWQTSPDYTLFPPFQTSSTLSVHITRGASREKKKQSPLNIKGTNFFAKYQHLSLLVKTFSTNDFLLCLQPPIFDYCNRSD